MTASTLAQRVADAFNQHGKFTARVVENNRAVEVFHLDTGALATRLWAPSETYPKWAWVVSGETTAGYRTVPESSVVEDVVRAVATSVLDERRS